MSVRGIPLIIYSYIWFFRSKSWQNVDISLSAVLKSHDLYQITVLEFNLWCFKFVNNLLLTRSPLFVASLWCELQHMSCVVDKGHTKY